MESKGLENLPSNQADRLNRRSFLRLGVGAALGTLAALVVTTKHTSRHDGTQPEVIGPNINPDNKLPLPPPPITPKPVSTPEETK